MIIDMSKIETVATYEVGTATYEIDHLGICRDSQWGEFAVYRDGKQVAEFALTEAMLRKEFRPERLPVTDVELIAFAQAACRGDLDEEEADGTIQKGDDRA